MATRGATAAKAMGAKRALVKLLFGGTSTTPSAISYSEMRTAYLEKVKDLHPDLNRSSSYCAKRDGEFQLLQEAWIHYDDLAKRMKKVDNGGTDANFTLFGVGCSFSDNDKEREMRDKIMDQASRGWLPDGELASGMEQTTQNESASPPRTLPSWGVSLSATDGTSSFSRRPKCAART